MNASRWLAVLLIAAGALGLAYGTISYTKATHDVKIGSLALSVNEKETVNVPAWAGIGAIGVGAVLLLFPRKSR
jgi:uncharacterized membrane protein